MRQCRVCAKPDLVAGDWFRYFSVNTLLLPEDRGEPNDIICASCLQTRVADFAATRGKGQ